MKKLLIAMAMMAAMSTSAYAANTPFYAGLGVEKATTHVGVATDSKSDGQLVLGMNAWNNVAVELGVTDAKDGTDLSLDLVGKLPVCKDAELLGTVGVAMATEGDNALNPQVGVGAQYHITDKVAIRALVKYEDMGVFGDNNDHVVKSSVGLLYSF